MTQRLVVFSLTEGGGWGGGRGCSGSGAGVRYRRLWEEGKGRGRRGAHFLGLPAGNSSDNGDNNGEGRDDDGAVLSRSSGSPVRTIAVGCWRRKGGTAVRGMGGERLEGEWGRGQKGEVGGIQRAGDAERTSEWH